jgi:hypothetical protein
MHFINSLCFCRFPLQVITAWSSILSQGRWRKDHCCSVLLMVMMIFGTADWSLSHLFRRSAPVQNHIGCLFLTRLTLACPNSAGVLDSAPKCWKHPLLTGEGCWLQLFAWPGVLGSKWINIVATQFLFVMNSKAQSLPTRDVARAVEQVILWETFCHVRTHEMKPVNLHSYNGSSAGRRRYWFVSSCKWSFGPGVWCCYHFSSGHGFSYTGKPPRSFFLQSPALILSQLEPQWKYTFFTVTLQANTCDELPEQLLGAARLSHIEPSAAAVPELDETCWAERIKWRWFFNFFLKHCIFFGSTAAFCSLVAWRSDRQTLQQPASARTDIPRLVGVKMDILNPSSSLKWISFSRCT